MAKTYNPDELYEQLKSYPPRGSTIPPFFAEALPLERLKEMANVKELSVLYRGEEKPWSFNTHYSGEGKSLGIALAVVRPDSPFSTEGLVNREKSYIREEQNSCMRTWDISLVPIGDFGYLQINRLTPENVPAGFLPPGLSPSDVVEVAKLVFIKGKVWVSIITYKGFVKPEQLVEIARGFEQLLPD